MDDSDSCAGSSPHSTKFTFSSGASVLMSSSGDDRSTAGSRSSIVSIPLSEVASSPVPASLSTAPANRGVSTPPKQHYEQLKPWRDPQLTETSIRHFAVNHQQLPPNCVAASIHHPSSYQHLSLLPSGITVGDQWRQQSLHKPKDYSNEKHFRERREIDLYEMERHKEMERERIERHQQQQQVSHASVAAAQHHQQQIQQHHHQQQQQQHQQHQQQQAQQQQQVQERERERREKEQCSNAEQAVSKHFEESLRRAKKQMRSAWTLNTLPPQHPNLQHLPPHLNMSSHVVQPQLPPHTSSAVSLPTIGIPPTVPQSQTTSSAGPVQQPPPKAPQSSQSSNIISVTDEQRRRMVECERLLVQRDRERERQREREKDREMDRLRQQQHQQEQQQRSYYAVAAGLQRNTVNTGLEYEVPHRANMSGMSGSQSKIVEKPPPQLKPEQGAFSLYSYSAFAQGYSKDMKAKPELCLPTPPPLMSDSKPPGSVIVKHDTHKQGPMQVVHSTKASPHPSHYKTASPATPRSHVIYEYRGAVPIITANERYKPTNLPTTQSAQYIQQPVVQPQSLTHQQQQQQQQTKSIHYSGVSATNSQNKPKVSSPAPSHIYGQPGEAGITAGIPVCRSQETTVLSGTKSSSPSPFQSHVYGPPPPVIRPPTVPPPAHSSRTMYDSRMFPAPAVKQTMPLTMHGSSPPTAAAAPIPMSRSPGIMMKMIPPKNIAPGQIGSPSYQTQPLDLGVTDRNRDDNSSPKRKASTPIHLAGSQVSLDVKKKRTETTQCTSLLINMPSTPPPIAPSPLMNATTTIPVSCSPDPKKSRTEQDAVIALTTTQPITTSADQCGTPVLPASSPPTVPNLLSVNTNPIRTSSADGTVRPSSTNSSISPSGSPGLSIQSAPGTPAKFSEPEKSTSPAPKRTGGCSNSAPRHLKKAWLQRHTGEDFEDTTGVVGSGSCVKLPLTLSPSPGSSTSTEASTGSSLNQQRPAQSETPPAHSLHNTGSNTVKSGKTVSKPHPKKNALNRDSGHNTDSDVKEESSSTDQEQSQKNPPKRKSTKVKRRKGGTRKPLEEKKKKNPASESEKESESDKESMSDKDSDSGTSGTSASTGKKNGTANLSSNLKDAKEPRKRGRRPKSNKDEPIKKRSRDETETKGPFRRPPVTQLKKTGESFLQDGPCFEVAPKLAKCRECRWTPNQRSKSTSNIFCRFYAFRRLRYTKNGQLAIAGFSDPHKDPSPDDIKLWMPDTESPPADLDMSMSRFLLAQVADQFCDLLQHEKEAIAEHLSDDKVVAWKRVVQGVREMCDVCETTLFNYHWACGKCGFVVCLDCYKDRKKKSPKIWGEVGRDRDDFSWLLCTNRSPHEQERLMLTQIIAGDSLQCLGKRIHEERSLWQIPQLCGCNLSKESPLKAANGACKELIRNLIKTECNGLKIDVKEDFELINGVDQIVKEEKEDKSALSWLADVALQNEGKKNGNSTNETRSNGEKDSNSDSSSESSDEGGQHSTLRELLIRSSNKSNGSSQPASPPNSKSLKAPKQSKMDALDVVLKSVQKKKVEEEDVDDITKSMQLKYYIGGDKQRKKYLPIRIMTLSESQVLYPDVPHTWLCDGKLLRLMDATHSGNVRIFQEQWKRGQPVLVSDVSKSLCMDLWRPESFTKDFGEDKNDLINCMNGNLVPNQPMKKFWDGFEYINKRLKDDKGQPMLLKLKDWPPGEDFAEILPTRFNDLMKALPLGDYTQRTGRLNLASRLPEAFVRPDLGPKMYNAYGSALHPTKGTTNLHLDISDAVNVMVYVGIPKDGQDEEYIKEAFRAIDEAGCDILTRRRVREKHELPGALWHIYAARDADKIRDLLNKVAIEKGARLEPNHDPIHDQSWYLDGVLRERLYKEYGVEGYPIAQCLGDAVFIPAGAPHQVRNLHNCIKVAEDFVSPENVSHCFHLTQEFRELSDSHSNHEDKLQIKNIIYHAVKDALACLSHVLGQKISESQRPPVEASGTNAPATAAARATDSPTSLETTETVADKQVKKESEDEV